MADLYTRVQRNLPREYEEALPAPIALAITPYNLIPGAHQKLAYAEIDEIRYTLPQLLASLDLDRLLQILAELHLPVEGTLLQMGNLYSLLRNTHFDRDPFLQNPEEREYLCGLSTAELRTLLGDSYHSSTEYEFLLFTALTGKQVLQDIPENIASYDTLYHIDIGAPPESGFVSYLFGRAVLQDHLFMQVATRLGEMRTFDAIHELEQQYGFRVALNPSSNLHRLKDDYKFQIPYFLSRNLNTGYPEIRFWTTTEDLRVYTDAELNEAFHIPRTELRYDYLVKLIYQNVNFHEAALQQGLDYRFVEVIQDTFSDYLDDFFSNRSLDEKRKFLQTNFDSYFNGIRDYQETPETEVVPLIVDLIDEYGEDLLHGLDQEERQVFLRGYFDFYLITVV